MTAAQPWVKWRFDKWRNDEGLKLSSLAARGLWAELLAIMHGCEPYGHLSVRGRAPTPKQIAALVGNTTEREVTALLAELEDNGVFSRSDDGLIYCRRMVRDNAAREIGRKNGREGGNPALTGRRMDGDNGEREAEDKAPPYPDPLTERVNPPLYDRNEIRDTRDENRESRGAAPSARGERLPAEWNPGADGAEFARTLGLDPAVTFEKFRDYWNAQPGQRGRKSDWLGTWRNWCRKEAESRRPGLPLRTGAAPKANPDAPNWNNF